MVGAAAGGFMILRFKPYVAKTLRDLGDISGTRLADAAVINRPTRSALTEPRVSARVKNWLVDLRRRIPIWSSVFLIEEWGADHRGAGSPLHHHALGVRGAIHHGRTFHLLYDRSLRSDEHVRVPGKILNVFGCTDLLPFTGVTFPLYRTAAPA